MDKLLTAFEVAELLGVSERHVTKLALQGEIPSLKLGRCRRFRAADLEKRIADLVDAECEAKK